MNAQEKAFKAWLETLDAGQMPTLLLAFRNGWDAAIRAAATTPREHWRDLGVMPG